MKKFFVASCLGLLLLSVTIEANSASTVILDNGHNEDSYWSLHSDSWLASRFIIPDGNDPVTLTDVEAYMSGGTGTATIVISDALETEGSINYSAEFTAGGGWSGVSGVSWDLSPGRYYAKFMVLDSQNFNGNYHTAPTHNGIIHNAWYASRWGWNEPWDGYLSLRISASDGTTSTPIPSTISLLGLGLLGLAGVNRKKQ